MLDLGERISVYQPEQSSRKFPEGIQANSHEELRLHRKEHPSAAANNS